MNTENTIVHHTDVKPLHAMFDAIPRRYDLINRIITLGMDRQWRNRAAKVCLSSQPEKVLDLCCGTGDLAVALALIAGNKVEVVGLDYSQCMLELAAGKAKAIGVDISFVNDSAASLPFPDRYFDCIGISFAFRNLTYKNPLRERHLAEMLRTLTNGGRLVIVESSQPASRIIRWLFHLYLRWFVFNTGYRLSHNRGAYHYLAESAAKFYSPGELKELLLAAGFREVSYNPLFLGAAGIHVVVK